MTTVIKAFGRGSSMSLNEHFHDSGTEKTNASQS